MSEILRAKDLKKISEPDTPLSRLSFTGKEVMKEFRQMGVYSWVRKGEYLYIGVSDFPLLRILTHDTIGVKSPIEPDDRFEVILCIDFFEARRLESQLISQHKPKYNTIRIYHRKEKVTNP